MRYRVNLVIVYLLAFLLLPGCSADHQADHTPLPDDVAKAVFSYDEAEISGAKPWTSQDFANNPDNFQFAILGDRGGGASPLGTFERAIEQLNWLQPEFVMSLGDYVEGYTSKHGSDEGPMGRI